MIGDAREIRRVLWITLFLNFGVAVAKLAYGLRSGVLAMAADGVHSFLDGGSNVVGLVAVSAARRPPDADHPYGHRKFETFAALCIGSLLLLASYEILKAAWDRLLHRGVADPGPGGYVVMVVTMAVNLGVSLYERREGQRLRSEILLADSVHTRTDLLTSASVVAALIGASLGFEVIDVLVSFMIVGWIGYGAWQVVRPALATLADEARLDSRELDELVMGVDGVRDVHRIRTRGSHDQVFVDMHLQLDGDVTVRAAHDVLHEVDHVIKERHPEVVDVLAHLEPHGDPVEGLDGSILGPPRRAESADAPGRATRRER